VGLLRAAGLQPGGNSRARPNLSFRWLDSLEVLIVKSYIIVFCSLILLASVGFSQSPAEEDLYKKLSEGPEKVKSLETVLKSPDRYSALILYFGADVALKEKRLEDSAFLYYAGQLRARFDKGCFPPKGTGGDNPFLLFAALSQQFGSVIIPAVMAEPKIFAKAIERVKNWNPKAPKEYEPGYEFTERKSEKDAHEAAKLYRTEFLSRMGDLSSLLNDAEYFAAFRVVQAYRLASDDKQRPTKEENEKATETMKRIEKDKGLKGFLSK
jgi:hypothetical protein